ncbi:MAG: single-stranded DNA-binding protein [Deltaproteobacteria bacterium]|nr:single-stranded DNA-binding protein [Deltaproteobacteria bacterium]
MASSDSPSNDWLDELVRAVERLTFAAPVAYVYNPLVYARAMVDAYFARYGRGKREVLFLGMNPGPWGMAQTGVPFGEVSIVRDWLGLDAPIGRPAREHPKRPVDGLLCKRSEVSGARLWGFARDRFQTPQTFFARFFVANYCPLAFLEASGGNLTPDKLPAREREPLFAECDKALVALVEAMRPRCVVGIGNFAEARARAALAKSPGIVVARAPHPSPASPAANRGWAVAFETALRTAGLPI